MATFNYDPAIGTRNFPEWEGWLADISDDEATRLLIGVGISPGDDIQNQTEYDNLMAAAQKYYKQIK